MPTTNPTTTAAVAAAIAAAAQQISTAAEALRVTLPAAGAVAGRVLLDAIGQAVGTAATLQNLAADMAEDEAGTGERLAQSFNEGRQFEHDRQAARTAEALPHEFSTRAGSL